MRLTRWIYERLVPSSALVWGRLTKVWPWVWGDEEGA